MNDESMSMSMYVTQDLALAATLVTFGHILLDVERTNPHRAGFCFIDDGLIEHVELYQTGQLTVEPRAFFDAIRLVKNRLYGN